VKPESNARIVALFIQIRGDERIVANVHLPLSLKDRDGLEIVRIAIGPTGLHTLIA
jgi:hypothetical protein